MAAAGVMTPAPPAAAGGHITQAGEYRSVRIESVRAIAALSVMVGHVWVLSLALRNEFDSYGHKLLTGGGMGVHLFFVLSGYLLFWPFARAMYGDHGRVDIKRYAINRALRILPLYYAVLAILFVVQPLDADRADWWRFALFLQSYSPDTVFRMNSPMWSLAVELQFYVVLPFLAAGLAVLSRGSLRRGALLLVVAGLVSAILRLDRIVLAENPAGLDFLAGYASLSTLFFLFATGMLLCLVRLRWEQSPPGWLAGPLGRADVWFAAAVLGWAVVVAERHWVEAIAVPAFLLIGACVLPLRAGIGHRVMESRLLAGVGVISYSLYLLHVPIIYALLDKTFRPAPGGRLALPAHTTGFLELLAIAVPLCLAAATAGYFLIERPFLRRRRRWAASAARHEDDSARAAGVPVAEPATPA